MVSFLLIILASLFFMGFVIRTKSIASGRKGPGILQPMKDILRLWKKGSVYSTTTSFIFQIAPTAYFTSVLMAILMIPHGSNPGFISFEGDFVMFAYILTFGKFFMIISALDTGSSFEGMGASREALFSMLVEPAFFILMGSFALLTGHTSFHSIFSLLHYGSNISYMLGVLASIVFVLIAMIENSRMPVDDPKTHLELTMVHEVMILDNSGFDLGLIMYPSEICDVWSYYRQLLYWNVAAGDFNSHIYWYSAWVCNCRWFDRIVYGAFQNGKQSPVYFHPYFGIVVNLLWCTVGPW